MTISEGDRERLTDLSREAYQHLRDGDLDEAEAQFNEILEIEANNNYALVGLGDTYRKRRKCRDAIAFYKRCLEQDPDNNYAMFGLADCYKAMRQFNRAIEVWEKYLQFDSENVTVLTRVADAHRKARNFERSKELYEQVLEHEAENAYALIGLGHLHYDFRMYHEALAYWQRMYNRPGMRPDIRVLTAIGNCYRKLKDFEHGTKFFYEALEREPANFYALFGIADCYRGMNQPGESLKYWNRILEQNPENKVILTRAGDAYRLLDQDDTAEMYYKRALNIEFDSYAVFGLALLAKKQGRFEHAFKSLFDLLESDPDNHRVAMEAADCALQIGYTSQARHILENTMARGSGNRSVREMYNRITRGSGGSKAADNTETG